MHRTWTWKIFSIATDFRGGGAGAKERLRLLQSIKDFHGPPCSPACNTPPAAAAPPTPSRQPEPVSLLRGVGNYCTVGGLGDGGNPAFFFRSRDGDETRNLGAFSSATSGDQSFSPRSLPCKPVRRTWLGDEATQIGQSRWDDKAR